MNLAMQAACAVALGMMLLSPGPVAGQELPDSVRCRHSLEVVKGGPRPSHSHVLGDALGCGDAGIKAVAIAIERIPEHPEADLQGLTSVAGLMRDDRVFDAAVTLLTSRPASPDVWQTGLFILGRHLDPAAALGMDSSGKCAVGWVSPSMGRNQEGQLSPDRPLRFQQVIQTLTQDRALPQPVRNLARCVAMQAVVSISPDIQAADLEVTVVCGRTLRIRSSAPDGGILGIREGEKRPWALNIDAGGEREITVDDEGSVGILLLGKVLWHGSTSTRPCAHG